MRPLFTYRKLHRRFSSLSRGRGLGRIGMPSCPTDSEAFDGRAGDHAVRGQNCGVVHLPVTRPERTR